MPPCCDTPARGRSTAKKALLVGIGYQEPSEEWRTIATSIPNVKKFAEFLRERGYTNIVEMTDEDGVEERYKPTKMNLKREIESFGRGVEPGESLVFYFAGHSDQMLCRTGSERDGMDEVLVTADKLKIRDNTLHKLLVKELPKGSSLTAIFDCCNSGTLLDLPHYECNNVYRPWVNKGERGSLTNQNCVVRRNCGDVRSGPSNPRRSTYTRQGSRGTDRPILSIGQALADESPAAAPGPSVNDPDHHNGQRCTSPERQFECEGFCRKEALGTTLERPDVISISSSNDGQASYDASTRSGGSISMTMFLIDILGKHPQITLTDLMTRLNHAVHSFTMGMHDSVKKERHAHHRAEGVNTDSEDTDSGEESKGEMNNFQDLQLGSMTPLDMNRLFTL